MTEGKILGWMKKEGEEIMAGEPILTIETDKVNYDIEAPESGILAKILVQVEDVIPVGAPMAIITQLGESVPTEFEKGSEDQTLSGLYRLDNSLIGPIYRCHE